MMKTAIMTILGVVALGALVQSNLATRRYDASERTPQERARRNAASRIETARLTVALDAIRRGDAAREAVAIRALGALHPGDPRRHEFARALALRGRIAEAYAVERGVVRFHRFDAPNDGQMEFYAGLAERAGHPEEAAWARGRMGDAGHFRVWREGEEDMLANGLRSPAWLRVHTVNRHMDYGLGLYPKHRAEIDALRRELLGSHERP